MSEAELRAVVLTLSVEDRRQLAEELWESVEDEIDEDQIPPPSQ